MGLDVELADVCVVVVGPDIGLVVVGVAIVGLDVGLGLAVVGVVVVGLDVGVALLYKLQIKKFLNGQQIIIHDSIVCSIQHYSCSCGSCTCGTRHWI